MTGKGGDYDGWILRLLDKAEDILYSYSEADWIKFAVAKIEEASGHSITKSQIAVLSEYREKVFQTAQDAGFTVREVTRYRDAKGRWSKEPTARAETKIVYRESDNQKFMKSGKADQLLHDEVMNRGARKKDKYANEGSGG